MQDTVMIYPQITALTQLQKQAKGELNDMRPVSHHGPDPQPHQSIQHHP